MEGTSESTWPSNVHQVEAEAEAEADTEVEVEVGADTEVEAEADTGAAEASGKVRRLSGIGDSCSPLHSQHHFPLHLSRHRKIQKFNSPYLHVHPFGSSVAYQLHLVHSPM